MERFDKVLQFLREQYLDRKTRGRFFIIAGGGLVLLGAISYFLDTLLPWASWGMIIRTALLIPMAAAGFALGNSAVIAYDLHKRKENPTWTPLKSRLSPTWRFRASLVIGAVLLVMVYAVTTRPGYTVASSLIVSVVIGLVVFAKQTPAEKRRSDLGIPDARDAALDSHLRTRANASKDVLARRKSESRGDDEKKLTPAQRRIKAAERRLEKAKRKV